MTNPGELSSRFIVGIKIPSSSVDTALDRMVILRIEASMDDGTITPDIFIEAVDPVPPPPTDAPAVANQAFSIGSSTLAGAGGWLPTNTGGAISSAAIVSGNELGHWAITSAGLLYPTQTPLNASYTLGCTFSNADGTTPTRTMTIVGEADTYSYRNLAELSALIGTTATVPPTTLSGKTIKGRGALHGGEDVQWPVGVNKGFFLKKSYTSTVTLTSHDPDDMARILVGPGASLDGGTEMRNASNVRFYRIAIYAPFIRGVNTPAQAASPALAIIGSCNNILFEECDISSNWLELVNQYGFEVLYANGLTAVSYTWRGIIGTNSLAMGSGGVTFLNNTIHGSWRLLNLAHTSGTGSFTVVGNECYDYSVDNTVIGGAAIAPNFSWNRVHSTLNLSTDPNHPDGLVQFIPGAGNVTDPVVIGNLMTSARSDAHRLNPLIAIATQGLFAEDVGTYHYIRPIFALNFFQTASPHALSLYNPTDALVLANTAVINPAWLTTPSQYPAIRILRHTTSGTGSGNVMADNVAYSVGMQIPTWGFLQNNTAPSTVAIAAYGSNFVGPSFTVPSSLTGVTAAFEGKPGGPLLTTTPDMGALGTPYVDYDNRVYDYPRLNSVSAWTPPNVTGATPNTLTQSSPVTIASILKSDGSASANGALVWWGDSGIEAQIETSGGIVVTPWTSSPPLMSAGQRFRLRRTSGASGATLTSRIWVGGVRRDWTMTST